MPFYEVTLVLRPLPKADIKPCLKRTADLIWKQNGALKRIEYLGLKNLPWKKASPDEGNSYKQGNYFVYYLSIGEPRLQIIQPELKLDLDILRNFWVNIDDPGVPDDYQCTLDSELLPPIYRPSVKPLLENKQVRADSNKLPIGRRYYSSMSTSQIPKTTGPGLLSIFEKNPIRLNRIQFLGELFNSQGYEIRIAGGAVRDILRGEVPSDIDFATTSQPQESLELVKQHDDIMRVIVTAAGQRHGTVAVKFKGFEKVDIDKSIKKSDDATAQKPADDKPEYDNESPFEITTLRCDHVTDGRHAEVEFVKDWKTDAERRDLTINSMFLTLDEGKIIDYFGGEADLKNGDIRFVGDAEKRIKEDYLRILRFFRFWSRYGKNQRPDESTLTSLRKNMAGLSQISGERIWTEIKKLLVSYPCAPAVSLMLELDVFTHIGLTSLKVEDPNKSKAKADQVNKVLLGLQDRVEDYSKNLLKPQLSSMSSQDVNNPIVRKLKDVLAAILFVPIVGNKDSVQEAYERLKFSILERETMLFLIETSGENLSLESMKSSLALAPVQDRQMILLKYWSSLIYKDQIELIEPLTSWEIPKFPISGKDVSMEAAKRKIKPQHIKTILQTLKEHWVSSDFSMTQQELLEQMNHELETRS